MSNLSRLQLLNFMVALLMATPVFSQERGDSFAANDEATANQLLPIEPGTVVLKLPEDPESKESLRRIADAMAAKNKAVRVREPKTTASSPLKIEVGLALKPDVSLDVVEEIIEAFIENGIDDIQLVGPQQDQNIIGIVAPAGTKWAKVLSLQSKFSAFEGFEFEIRARHSNDLPREIQFQIVELETELAEQRLRLGAEHPTVRSLEEKISALRNADSRDRLESKAASIESEIDRIHKFAELVAAYNELMKERRYAEAEIVAKQARELMPDEPESTIMVEKAKLLRQIALNNQMAQADDEDTLAKLHQAKTPFSSSATSNSGDSDKAGVSIAEYRRRLVELEKPVLEFAEKVRASEGSLGKQHPEHQKLLADLRTLVQQTFAARQEIQRAELSEFTGRLERMKQSIETREKIADKIVDRRVEELLNPNIEWSQRHSQSVSQESPFASTAPEPLVIKRDPAASTADKETVSLTLFEVTDATFMPSDDGNTRQTAAPADLDDQLTRMLKNKTAKLVGKQAIETTLNRRATFRNGGTFEVPAATPQAKRDVEFGTRIEVTPRIVASEKAFDITWNESIRDFNNVVSGIPGINAQQVHFVVKSPLLGGAGYLIGPLRGSGEGRRLFAHFVLDAPANVRPPSQSQTDSVQIRLRCNHRMSIDSGDVVFADDGRVATVSRMVGVPVGFNFVEGDHRGPYLLTFERNGSSEEAQAWLTNHVLSVDFSAEDEERTAAGQLVTKVIFLSAGTGSVETTSGHDVEAGVDPVSVAAEKGTVIGVVRISLGKRVSHRSGASVFENQSERATIAIGDVLNILVFAEDKVEPKITFSARVSDEGAVALSELGKLKLAGLSAGAAEQKLVEYFNGTTQFETTPSVRVDVVHPGPRTRSIEAEIVFANADGERKVAYWHGIPIDGTNTAVLVGNEFRSGDTKGLQAKAAAFKKSIESIKVLAHDAQGTVAVPAKIERFNSKLGLLLVSMDSQHLFASLPLASMGPASGQKVFAERLSQSDSVLLSECADVMPGILRVKPEGWTHAWDGTVIMDSTGKQLLGIATTFFCKDSSCEGVIPASAIEKWLSTPISEISVDLVCDQRLEVTLPDELPHAASKAASFEISANENTQLQLSSIDGAEDLDVLLTIEPRCSVSEAINFYRQHSLQVELKDSDVEQLKSGMHITKALYISPGSDEIRATINVTEKADVPPIEVGIGSSACIGIVRMSPAEINSL